MKKRNESRRNKKQFAAMISSAVLLTGGLLPVQAQPVQAAENVTTVTLYPTDANLQSGLVGGYKADIFADRGLAVEVWT